MRQDASSAEATRYASLAKDTALVHFWGDTHGQSNETLGTNYGAGVL